MTSEGDNKEITLTSSDSAEFLVDVAVAMESRTIRLMIEDGCADNVIPLPNVSSETLSKVITYCTKHVYAAGEDLKDWDAEFVKVSTTMLIDLIVAANYLNIKGLLDLTCQTVSDMIKGKTPEEISEIFNIKIDITQEEEEEEETHS